MRIDRMKYKETRANKLPLHSLIVHVTGVDMNIKFKSKIKTKYQSDYDINVSFLIILINYPSENDVSIPK